jgi:hypothetical protein
LTGAVRIWDARAVSRRRDARGRLLAGALLAWLAMLAGLGSPPAGARASSALYYQSGKSIDRLSLVGPARRTRVLSLGSGAELPAIVVAGRYVYWAVETGRAGRDTIMRALLDGRGVRRLVGGLTFPDSLTAAGGYLYWADQNSIGRVGLGGSHLQRRFIALAQERGGGVAEGLASDGTYLYFSRCQDSEIGRADLDGTKVDDTFVSLGSTHCPQGLSVSGGDIYWTELGTVGDGTIGRAALDGTGADDAWLDTHTDQGPFQVAADPSHVYWTSGGAAGSPSYTERANADGSHIEPRFLQGSEFAIALA